MIPDLQCILPYLEEESLAAVSLTLILQLLANPSIINGASQVDQQTLLVRINSLLKSNHSITRWKATKLLTVSVTHPVLLLSSHTANAITGLVKILESKCFLQSYENPTTRELITLKSTAECLGFVLDQIRGKPTLTREVLTPKLPNVIASLIEVNTLIPDVTLPVLSKLLMLNTTTFRPFGTKFENSLRSILNDGENYTKLNDELKSMVMKSLALVSFILAREKQGELWRENVNMVILELKSVISIYEAFLDLSADSDYNVRYQNLPKLPENCASMKLLFGTLSIDINESPVEIFKVSQRISVLVDLLLAYIEISTVNAVSIPLGHYVTVGEILASLNTSYTHVKKDIRDEPTRKMIEESVNNSKLEGIKILGSLVRRFPGDLYPRVYKILALLDASIPVQTKNGKIHVDNESVYENEFLVTRTLEVAGKYLNLTERFNDMSVLGRLVESSLILKEPREPVFSIENKTQDTADVIFKPSGHRKKQNKSKSVVSLSDILSHKQYFISPPCQETLQVVRSFFNTLITKCELSPGKLSSIIRFVILDAVSNMELIKEGKVDAENQQIVELLENVLLFPGKSNTSVSVIPIISGLIGNNSKIYSLLVNPRFPLLPRKHDDFNTPDELEEIELEEEMEAQELASGDMIIPKEKRSLEDVEALEKANKRQQVSDISEKVTSDYNSLVSKNPEAAVKALKQMEAEAKEQQENESLSEKVVGQVEGIVSDGNSDEISNGHDDADDDEDMGSDFEIPEINVEDD